MKRWLFMNITAHWDNCFLGIRFRKWGVVLVRSSRMNVYYKGDLLGWLRDMGRVIQQRLYACMLRGWGPSRRSVHEAGGLSRLSQPDWRPGGFLEKRASDVSKGWHPQGRCTDQQGAKVGWQKHCTFPSANPPTLGRCSPSSVNPS